MRVAPIVTLSRAGIRLSTRLRAIAFAGLLLVSLAAILPPIPAQDAAAPAPLAQAARLFSAPEGFHVSLFAGEPDVVQPIAMTTDAKGRLWIVESLTYPGWLAKEQGQGQDRIIILADKDGDGRFDDRKVFFDKGVNLSGIAVGMGGVWLCATPHFLFIPDANGDDTPDAPPQILLDGWDIKARHNVFAALQWGPDGWLYGCNGILSNSRVGKPGCDDQDRTPINCGVWRYHPTQHQFEAVAWGTTNPWGLDFNDYGDMFITNCVIKHLWHVVPGAHFQRMFGQDLNPHSYGLIESCADHIHWGGGAWQSSRGGKGDHDKPGGGHAHVGAMVYLGDNFPAEYRNRLFTCNVHGNRVNQDELERHGSSYVAHHAPDFIRTSDSWFRGIGVMSGPDGGVYVSDWCDTGECHNYDVAHKTSGRIYKVTWQGQKPATLKTSARTPATSPPLVRRGDEVASAKSLPLPVLQLQQLDLTKLADLDLVALQFHANDWYVRQARLELQRRAATKRLDVKPLDASLRKLRSETPEVTRQLRLVWVQHILGLLTEADCLALLKHESEYLRGWGIRLEVEDRDVSPAMLQKFVELAQHDPAPSVRLALASALQRLPLDKRWEIAAALIAHAEDVSDSYLPLMYWYGIEPLVPADKNRSVKLVTQSKIPLIREYITRRLVTLK